MAGIPSGRNYGPIRSFKAGAAITANKTLKLSAGHTVIHTTAITEQVIGVALETVASGEWVSVLTMSGATAQLISGGSISAGNEVMPKASGDGVVDVAGGATALSCGVALEDASSGETFEAIFRPSVKCPANS